MLSGVAKSSGTLVLHTIYDIEAVHLYMYVLLGELVCVC